MHFMRNPEVRWIFWPNLLIASSSCILLYFLARDGSLTAGKLAVLTAAAFVLTGIVFLVVSAVHSKKVVRFTQRIEKNLHGHQDLQFADFREGDFAVLEGTTGNMVNAHFQQESLLQTEKERLVNELAMIAHEIRTPLQGISYNTEQMAEPDEEPMMRRLIANRTIDLVERLQVFVTALLKLSRLEANVVEFHLETFPARELIDSAVTPFLISMEVREQTLDLDVPEDILIEGDKFWLTDALVNVVKNCMEHTPNGGTISISVSSNAVFTCIQIRDTGPGIPPEELPKVFDRYHKGKDSSSNSIGIGLTLTKRVIHDMGGTIQADNAPEGGALFTIHLFKVNV